MDIKAEITKILKDNQVTIFSKTYCPFCHRAKSLFNKMKINYKLLELDNIKEDYQTVLNDNFSGIRTVPQVFIGSKFIGGCDDVMKKYKNKQLHKLLKEANVKFE